MTFASPWFLLAGLLLLPVVWAAVRSQAPLPRWQRRSVAALQVAAVVAAVVALAQPWTSGPGAVHRLVVHGGAADGKANELVRAWRDGSPFGSPFTIVGAGSRPVVGAVGATELPVAAGTPDLAAAVRAALASVPEGARAAIALCSDGRHDGAPLAGLAAELTHRSVPLHLRRLPAPFAVGSAMLHSVAHPPRVAPGEAFRLEALVTATAAANARLEVLHQDRVVGAADLALRGGTQRCVVDAVVGEAGVAELDVRLVVGGKVDDATGRERTALLVDQPLRVLHLAAEPSRRQALARTLLPHGIATLAPEPGEPLVALPGFFDCHAVLVDDLPAGDWLANQGLVRTGCLNHGMGLVLAGTNHNLGPGGYAGSQLADILPVRMPQREERRDPSVSLVLIVDTSGSMGGGRLELAKEVARLAVQKLQPHDKVGLIEFHGSKRWAAPLQPATNTIEITRALNRLQVGGGTIIYDALEESYFALLNAHTRFQHVLVLTDGGVESGPFETLVRRMAQAGQTVSSVLIGPQANSPFLLSLAQWGRGRFYSCPDKFQLPDLQFREPQSALLPAVQERRLPVRRAAEAEATAAFAGDDLPPTGGLVEASVRPGAEVLLRAGGGDPYLVGWDQGAGRVLVLAGQALGPQSGELRDDPAYAAFLADLLRSAASGAAAFAASLELTARERDLEVTVGLPPSTILQQPPKVAFVGGPAATLVDAGGGRLRANLPWRDAGAAVVEVRSGDVLLAAGAAVAPRSRMLRAVDATVELTALAERTGGSAAGVEVPLPVVEPASAANQPQRLDRVFAAIALLLFVAGLLLRRLSFDRLPRPTAGAGGRSVPVAGLLLACWGAFAAPGFAQQDPGVPPADAAAIQLAIDTQLRTTGDLAPLQQQWSTASPLHRLLLARAVGDLAAAVEASNAPELQPSQRELRVRLLDILGRPKDALTALGEPPAGMMPLEHGEWLLRRALLHDAARDPQAAVRDLEAAIAAARDPAFAERAGLLAGTLGHFDLALRHHGLVDDGSRQAYQAALRRGLWQERRGDLAAAATEYTRAFRRAVLRRDGFFALARVVAAMRAAGRLPELADDWLQRARGTGEPLGDAELRVLFEVLRELGRARDGLAVLGGFDEDRQREFAALALELAIDAGDAEQAVARQRQRLAQRPQDAVLRTSLALLLADLARDAEAAAVLREGIAGARPKDLRLLCQTASELGLDESVAAVVAAFAGSDEEGAAVEAALLEAAHHRRQGRDAAAVRVLLAARSAATRSSDQLRLAEQLESLGRQQEATELYGSIYDATGTEDIGLRLAWLLSESKQDGDRQRAQAIFRRVWTSAGSPARRVQAEEHVLDLAAREGTLADLAIELEQQLADPATPNRPAVRDALVKIYTRARDTTGAAAILQQWATEEPQHATFAMEQLARVYQAAEEFKNHERTLQRLLAQNPDAELDYRQQLAMSALERGRPEDARQQIAGLLGKPGTPDTVALEFSAGIFTLAAQHDAAVKLYRRALALHPERVETFLLLGNALRAAGQRELAIGTFQELLLRPLPDDLFVVAVDGLLNMDAPAPALAAAVRAVRLRLCERPEQVFLHRVLQDLLEGLKDEPARIAALQDTIVVAGEQRVAFVRELMQEAETRRDFATYVVHGRTLLLLGDEVPPSVYLSLGEALLLGGDLDAATRAFARARLAPDFGSVEKRIAELYEGADRLAEAERVRRRILRRLPDDPAAQLAVATLAERQGARARALPLFLRVALQTLDAEIEREPAAGGRRGIARLPVLPAANRNRSTGGPAFAEPFAGVLRCAAAPADLGPLQARLLDIAANARTDSRLMALQHLRHLALVFADGELHRQVLALEDAAAAQGDARASAEVLARRLAAGELEQALPLVGASGAPTADTLRLLLLAGDPGALAAAAAKASTSLLGDLGRALALAGRRDEVVALLALVDGRIAADPDGAGAVANELRRLLGLPVDPAVATARARQQLQRALGRDGALSAKVTGVLAALRGLPDLPAAERQGHVDALVTATIAAKDQTAAERLLGDGSITLLPPQRSALVDLAFTSFDRVHLIGTRARYLVDEPAERSLDLLRTALRRFNEDERRQQVLNIVAAGVLPEPVLLGLLDGLRFERLTPVDRVLFQNSIDRGKAPLTVQRALAERMAKALPGDPLAQLLLARTAGDAEAQRMAALRALPQLATQRGSEDRIDVVVAALLRLVTAEDAQQLLPEMPANTPLRLRVELHRRAGDKLGAADALLAAYQQRPDDTALLFQAASFFESEGMDARAVELFRTARQRASQFYPYQAQQLARLELRLGDPMAALASLRAAKDRSQMNFRLMLRVLAEVPDAALRANVLQDLLQQRGDRSSSAGIVLSGLRGIDRAARDDRLAVALAAPTLPQLAPPDLTAAEAAPSDWDLLAFLPEGEAVAEQVLRTLDGAARAQDLGLYRGLLGAARRAGTATARVDAAARTLATRPHDAEALRVMLAAAQIGLPVPSAALRTAWLQIATQPRPDLGTLAGLVDIAERSGERELAEALLRVLLQQRSRLGDGQLRPWLPGLLAMAGARMPEVLLSTWLDGDAATAGAAGSTEADTDLLAALVLHHPDPAVVHAAIAEVMRKRFADDSPGVRDALLHLPWTGLLLQVGDGPGALQALQRKLPFQPPARSLPGPALAAAMPPIERWRAGAEVEPIADALVTAAATGDDERRGLFARLGAILAARLHAAGRTEAASDLRARLRTATNGLSFQAADWLE